jgi:hypothetical protein
MGSEFKAPSSFARVDLGGDHTVVSRRGPEVEEPGRDAATLRARASWVGRRQPGGTQSKPLAAYDLASLVAQVNR